jgi:glycosyltransferase involved in cell wall biosynthesis
MIRGQITVSVVMHTYNHEEYIEEAVRGVLMQECDFDFEFIISNDRSPDQTDSVIKRIIEQHPNSSCIKYFNHEANLGMISNWIWTLKQAKGKYIALCEGDDYWTDSLKLQKQTDYLNSNKEYSFVFTPALVDKLSIKKLRNRYDKFDSNNFNLESVLKLGGGFYPTVTAFFDSEILELENNFLKLHTTGDYPLAILAALRGKIGYIDDVTGVYRVQNNSVSNKLFKTCEDCITDVKNKYEKNIKFLKFLFNEIKINRKLERELLSKENYILLSKHINCGHYSGFYNLFFKLNLSLKHRIRIIVKLIYRFLSGNKSPKIQKNN